MQGDRATKMQKVTESQKKLEKPRKTGFKETENDD